MGKPDLALPHLQKAIALNPENEVSYYRLSQTYKALGNRPGQQKALRGVSTSAKSEGEATRDAEERIFARRSYEAEY